VSSRHTRLTAASGESELIQMTQELVSADSGPRTAPMPAQVFSIRNKPHFNTEYILHIKGGTNRSRNSLGPKAVLCASSLRTCKLLENCAGL
jgi:hypothetical protein